MTAANCVACTTSPQGLMERGIIGFGWGCGRFHGPSPLNRFLFLVSSLSGSNTRIYNTSLLFSEFNQRVLSIFLSVFLNICVS